MQTLKHVLLFLALILSSLCISAQQYLPKSKGEIIEHTYYSLAYSEDDEQAFWVYYVLTPDMINGASKRTNNFRADKRVTTRSATLADYKASGYDRGHLCPAASMTINEVAMSESFLMSNMSPQVPSFNRGGWKKLENIVRNIAAVEQKIYVVTGPLFTNPIGRIGVSGVTVPSYYYKIVYSPLGAKMIAFLMPNKKIEHPIVNYVVSVDQVEDATGIDFFHSLPDSIEDALESTVDASLWEF